MGSKALLGLLAASKDPQVNIRASAINLLGDFPAQAEAVLPILVMAFNDKEIEVRHNATRSLARLGPKVRGVVPAFVEALGAMYPDVRQKSAGCLTGMGPAAKDGMDHLWKCVQGGKDIEVRRRAAEILGRIGKDDRPTTLRFIEMVRSKNPDEEFLGAIGLGQIGKGAKESVTLLIEAVMRLRSLNNSDQKKRLAMALLSALGSIGEDAQQAVPEMIKFLQDKEEANDIRKSAAEALGDIGPKAKIAVQVLTKAANDPDLNATCEAAIRRITR